MKILQNKKLMLLGAVFLTILGTGAAQTVDTADSEVVDAFNTTSEQLAFEFSNITSEDVEVWLYNDEERVGYTGEIAVDDTGIATYKLDNYTMVDQIKVAPVESEASAVDEVTVYYDYTGTTPVDDTANYNGNQVFSDFTVTSGAMNALYFIIPFAVLLLLMKELT